MLAPRLQFRVSTEAALDVREFSIRESLSELWSVDLIVLCTDPSLDFDEIIGRPAQFSLQPSFAEVRSWDGVCSHAEQVALAPKGYSTYRFRVVPRLWLATQGRNYRIFQGMSEPDIVKKILGEWGISPELRIDPGDHKPRAYRVQYGESDFAFISRMLEDAGITFFHENGGKLIMSDAPQTAGEQAPLAYFEQVNGPPRQNYCTKLRVNQQVRPGRYVLCDNDLRKPAAFKSMGKAAASDEVESQLERFHYVPGAFLFAGSSGGSSPAGDDRGTYRHDESIGAKLAERRLQAKRAVQRVVSFKTNAAELHPGQTLSIVGHASEAVAGKQLVTSVYHRGHVTGEWAHLVETCSAANHFRPALSTPKPRALGIESATVVGAGGDEIHTDELGRVRVHFHWDRESGMNEQSSCWIHVSQPWAGSGFGGINLPRVGQEVLVSFLGGDPDRPVVTGRVFTSVQAAPYGLPGNKTQSGWKSLSSPGGGGYNEIMFEDAAGSELIRVQAERDRQTLIKNDEKVKVKNDRTELVEHDEKITIKNDRTELVEHDEKITILNDRTEVVGRDESVTIGRDRTEVIGRDDKHQVGNDQQIAVANNRSESVGNDEQLVITNNRDLSVGANLTESVGVDRSRTVGENESIQIGSVQTIDIGDDQNVRIGKSQRVTVQENQEIDVNGSHSLGVGGSSSVNVGKTRDVKVAISASESVGAMKSIKVGGAFSTAVAGAMSTSVGGASTEQVGLMKNIVVGQMLTITCGASSITMDAAGTIEISGVQITINGKRIDLN